MGTQIQPLWEVKEIYQDKQVHSYGFRVATEKEAYALYERMYRAYPNSVLVISRVDGILAQNVRYLSWLKWRNYLNWVAILLAVLGAGLSVFPNIQLDIQIAGVPVNVFALITLVALAFTSFVGLFHGPDQQAVMRALMLPIYPGKLSAPPIQRSDPQ